MNPVPGGTLSAGYITRFWSPLAATWVMMAAEGPLIAATIARLPDPKLNLAAHGVAFRGCPNRSWRLRWLSVDSCYAATSFPSTGGVPSSSRCALSIQRSL